MDTLFYIIWMLLTFPIWFLLSLIWIIIKFCFLFLLSLYGMVKSGFRTLEDLLLYPIRLIYQTFKDGDIIINWFSNFYYEHFWWSLFIGFILIFLYSASSQRN